jgi:hypothetical protein
VDRLLPLQQLRIRDGIWSFSVSLLAADGPAARRLINDGRLRSNTIISRYGTRHGTYAKVASIRGDGLHIQAVALKIALGISENLTSSLHLRKGRMHVARHNRGVVHQVQEPTGMLCKDDLLLGALNGGCEVVVVSLLELLSGLQWSAGLKLLGEGCSYDVAELCLSDKTLGLCTYELLFELDNLGALRLLVLQLGNLVGDLTVVSMSCVDPSTSHTLALWSRLG